MKIKYNTVAYNSKVEMIEKKSRFIGYAKIVENEEKANYYIDEIRKEYWDASHVTYAYAVLNENNDIVYKFSDDGEPQGTAGVPILEIIKSRKLENVIILVVRYFGGTLLGTGGLVRAYGSTAKMAIDEAKMIVKKLYVLVSTTMDYKKFEQVKKLIKIREYLIVKVEYLQEVSVTFGVLVDEYEDFVEELEEILTRKLGNIASGTMWK